MNVPSIPQDFGLPLELKSEIDRSVEEFEAQWGTLKFIAKENGWLEKYRKEITSLVMKAYQTGRRL
jgi:hypothetical protein